MRDKSTKEYRAWSNMIQRCTNPKKDAFKYYGARGVTVCERWRSYDSFLADVGVAPSPRHSLDRINPTGHYEPGNVRWATNFEQACNKTTSLPPKEQEAKRLARLSWTGARKQRLQDTRARRYSVDPEWDS